MSEPAATCHRQIAEDYSRTGMGRSVCRPAPSNTLERYDEEYYHALSDTHFSMRVREGQYYQRRWQIGFGGQETNVEGQLPEAIAAYEHAIHLEPAPRVRISQGAHRSHRSARGIDESVANCSG